MCSHQYLHHVERAWHEECLVHRGVACAHLALLFVTVAQVETKLADAQASHARALRTAEADAAAAVGGVEVQLAAAKAQLVAEGMRLQEAAVVRLGPHVGMGMLVAVCGMGGGGMEGGV